MKNIINYVLRLLVVPVLLISFSSCEKETIGEVQHRQDIVTIEYHDESQSRAIGSRYGINYLDLVENEDDSNIGGPDGPTGPGPTGPNYGCPLEDCDTAMPAFLDRLQQLANEHCETIYGEIACCMDGYITYAIMYADPTNPPCPNVPTKW